MTRDASSATAKSAPFCRLATAMAVETALVNLHFLYGAHLYETSRIESMLSPRRSWAFVLGVFARLQNAFVRWGLVVTVGVPFLGKRGWGHVEPRTLASNVPFIRGNSHVD